MNSLKLDSVHESKNIDGTDEQGKDIPDIRNKSRLKNFSCKTNEILRKVIIKHIITYFLISALKFFGESLS